MAEFFVGMKPTAANEFKRGGFLEVQPKQSHCRVGLNQRPRLTTNSQITAEFLAQSPSMVLAQPQQHFLGRMRTLPLTCSVLVRLGQGGIGVNGA
jgi:hypothetical protein